MEQCRAKQRCVRCGEQHSFEECQQKDNPKCANCGEEHSAAYNSCKVAKKAKEIQKIKVVEKLTYAQASKKLIENEKQNTQNQQKTNIKVTLGNVQASTPSMNHSKEGVNTNTTLPPNHKRSCQLPPKTQMTNNPTKIAKKL